MKQKDVTLIVAVAIFSTVLSLLLSNVLINRPGNKQQKAEIVEKITDNFQQPDPRYFNDQSIDPTKVIRIGDGSNPAPFVDNKE